MKTSKVCFLSLISLFLVVGCAQQNGPVVNVQQECAMIKVLAKNAVLYGAKDKVSKEDIQKAITVMDNDILPALRDGKTVISIKASSVLISKLDDKYKMLASDVLSIFQSFLPTTNVEEALGKDNTARLLALFEGLDIGSKEILRTVYRK